MQKQNKNKENDPSKELYRTQKLFEMKKARNHKSCINTVPDNVPRVFLIVHLLAHTVTLERRHHYHSHFVMRILRHGEM